MDTEKQINVLVVEDDKFLMDTMAKRFVEAGFHLDYASDGNMAIDTIKKSKPDVAVLDILLPNKSGFQILEEIKADPETKNIPVIFLSNLGSKEDIEKGKRLGAFSFLIKATVNIGEIVSEIKRATTTKPAIT
jgi:two-component system, cell cycle response regulator